MLTKRIIPCLDVKDGRVVKGVNFLGLRDAGDPVEIAQEYDRQRADEIIFLDITASYERRPIFLDVVRKTAEKVFMPLTVGGGIRTLNDIRYLLNAGADKVSINTAAVEHPNLIKESSQAFGSQCIVTAVDAKRVGDHWKVFIHGGRTPTGKNVLQWVREVEELGSGEILLTSMDFDGTKNGFDLLLTKEVSRLVNIPVIASGGAGTLDSFYQVFEQTRCDAALAASVFHYGELTINDVKNYLKAKSIEVRT